MTGVNPARACDQGVEPPGGVYLCQVNESVSCAACCGLYNLADTGRASMTALLARRSRLFAQTPRDVSGIDGFARQVMAVEPQNRPFRDFHHCPFVGLIGEDKRRVGCLLHPLGAGNNGVDYRGLSYYGTMACRTYFCPTHYQLSTAYKELLRLAAIDWYLYGLIVTEKKLVEALFGLVESRLQQPLQPELFDSRPLARQKLTDLLALKSDWLYRSAGSGTLCHNFFTDNHTPRPAVDYMATGATCSMYDAVFVELEAVFCNSEQLRQAERMVASRVQAVARALQAG